MSLTGAKGLCVSVTLIICACGDAPPNPAAVNTATHEITTNVTAPTSVANPAPTAMTVPTQSAQPPQRLTRDLAADLIGRNEAFTGLEAQRQDPVLNARRLVSVTGISIISDNEALVELHWQWRRPSAHEDYDCRSNALLRLYDNGWRFVNFSNRRCDGTP
jgi:hypothetical protein